MRKVIFITIALIGMCVRSQAQESPSPLPADRCVMCRTTPTQTAALLAQMANVGIFDGNVDRHGRYHPPHKADYWSKIRNFYKPNGDEAGDREGFNVHELGRKQIYFGISLGVNAANYRIVHKPFNGVDTIKSMRPALGPGFNLGIIANWQFHRYFDLRLIPALSFSDKSIKYTTVLRKSPDVKQTISSIYLSFPLQLRFKSDPIKNTRIYVIAGARYDYDLASNSNTRAQTLLKVSKHDVSVDYGMGVMIYFPYFIMSPEFKVSQGVINVNSPTNGYIYSRVIEKLYSRTYTFTLNLEG
ncbi:MAG: PorT protein [Bacteroidetes bacterium]|nr:PorT protein [Bacteroidota bacterium]